ncbi:MAG: S41 family peptidase [Cyclobacteriaceae bacterium]|nr:S41 family peptidase [Cyclobacteriaceae bacterium]
MRVKKISFMLLVAAGFSLITLLSSGPNERYFDIAKNLDIFSTLFKEVNAYYVDEVNPNDLMKTGIEAMLSSLDPYTNFISEDDIEDYRTMTTGQYGGIGALIGRNNEKNMIIMPYEGFPAFKAGLKIGDEILKIDNVDVRNKSTSEISQLLKGQAKTPLKVTVQRYGQKDELVFNMVREKITIDNVPYHGMVNESTGYIRLTDFTTGAGKEVANALNTLKKQGAEKVILDLRDNPGGLLVEAVNVANVFIPKGREVVSTKGKITDWNKTYKTLENTSDDQIPVAVLISSRSASAAEIVAGVIQDYDRGILIGERTFGKGLVQATRPLTYNSQLKVTTAKYYIPSGRCIQAINYSIRDEDGSITKIPDSLKVAFNTKNGRTVYDGGGVDPDISIDRRTFAPITLSLVSKGLIFEYATKYFYENQDNKPDPKKFKITQDQYKEFIVWLEDKDYDYTTRVEKTIDNLTEYAKKEKYFENVKDQIEKLKKQVMHNKDQDLQQFRTEISEILEEEIISRYHLRAGATEASFDDDDHIQSAIKALADLKKYDELLARTNE